MSTYKSVADTIKEIEYWIRLATFLHEPLKNALLRILHNTSGDTSYDGLLTDPHQLYKELQTKHLNKINKLKKKRILKQDQIDLIFPKDKKTDSSKFDITLICILIRNCCDRLPPPVNGWDDKNPPAHDTSIAANVVRAREWRNYVHHTEPKDIDQQIFDDKWMKGTTIIHDLNYCYDTRQLKTISLDPKHQIVLDSLNYYIGQITKKQNTIESDVKKLQQKQTADSTAISDLNQEQTGHSAAISDLQQKQIEDSAAISDLQQKQTGDSAAISILVKQVDTINEEVKNLRLEHDKNKIATGLNSGTKLYLFFHSK